MITYHITNHHVTLGACTTRQRKDAAQQELWRVIRDALSWYGLCDTQHAWTLYRQWQTLCADMRKTLPRDKCWSADFRITDGVNVSFLSVRT